MAHRALQLLANEPGQRLNPGRWERRIGEMTAVVIRHYGGPEVLLLP